MGINWCLKMQSKQHEFGHVLPTHSHPRPSNTAVLACSSASQPGTQCTLQSLLSCRKTFVTVAWHETPLWLRPRTPVSAMKDACVTTSPCSDHLILLRMCLHWRYIKAPCETLRDVTNRWYLTPYEWQLWLSQMYLVPLHKFYYLNPHHNDLIFWQIVSDVVEVFMWSDCPSPDKNKGIITRTVCVGLLPFPPVTVFIWEERWHRTETCNHHHQVLLNFYSINVNLVHVCLYNDQAHI